MKNITLRYILLCCLFIKYDYNHSKTKTVLPPDPTTIYQTNGFDAAGRQKYVIVKDGERAGYNTDNFYAQTQYNAKQPFRGAQYFYMQSAWWEQGSYSDHYTETDIDRQFLLNPGGLKVHMYCPKVKANQNAQSAPLPVIVYGYGGGFFAQFKSAGQGDKEARWLAERGYIVVVPEYRIGIDLYEKNMPARAIWRAVQDMRKVIRWARTISSSTCAGNNGKLTYVGSSSGAVIGIHNLYATDALKPASAAAGYPIPVLEGKFVKTKRYISTFDLGSLDRVAQDTRSPNMRGDETYNPLNVQDITVAISGAIGDVNWIATAGVAKRPKALMTVQHPQDGVVPYGKNGLAFKDYLIANWSTFDYPLLSGTGAIKDFYNDNNALRPYYYRHAFINEECFSDQCIRGDAEGETKLTKTFFHNPTFLAGGSQNELVLHNILYFIEQSTLNLNGLVARRSNPSLSSGNDFVMPESTTKTILNNLNKDNQILVDDTIIVYPNPVSGHVLNITGVQEKSVYSITNTLGQIVSEGVIENKSLSTAKLSQGNYFLTVTKGEERIVKQFIKQ